MKKIVPSIPEVGKKLVKYKGIELIDRLGNDVIVDVVGTILCGGNVRAMTEKLTQRRIGMSNASMLITFINTYSTGLKSEDLYNQIQEEFTKEKLSVEEKNYLMWIIGLTGKSIQNVLRGDKSNLGNYLKELSESMDSSNQNLTKEFGDLAGSIGFKDKKLTINWKVFAQIALALGTQTLAIRGAEKSMYGKFFEKLILGSLLSILDFELVNKDSKKTDKVFWLSERGEKRESDATLLYKAGVGVRFDIGFIGVGNTEISLDKVSRFEREMEKGNQKHYMKTIVLVDRIGEGSRIVEMAKAINAYILQMSMNYWVYEVASILQDSIGFDHEILKMPKEKSIQFINSRVKKLNLKDFISKIPNGIENDTEELEFEG